MKAFLLVLWTASFPAWALTSSAPATETQWNAIVQIRTEGVDTDGTSVPSYCNGTLLSAHLVLTAAHCLAQAQALHSFQIQVDLGNYKYLTRPDGTSIRIGYVSLMKETLPATFHFPLALRQRIERQGLKTQIAPEEDLAVVGLGRDLPLGEGFSFPKVITHTEFLAMRDSLGAHEPRVVSINYFSDLSTSDVRRGAVLDRIDWRSPSSFESKATSRVEEGDSGSPLWAKVGTEIQLIGVVKGRAQSYFSNWDVFSALDGNGCDIARELPGVDRTLVCR